MPHSALPQPPQDSFKGLPTTGWKDRYKDQTDGKLNDDDQTHHVVAYMLLGYYRGQAASWVGSYYHKLEQGQMANHGDIRLGIAAGRLGARLAHMPDATSEQLVQEVDRFAAELTDPAGQPQAERWSVPQDK